MYRGLERNKDAKGAFRVLAEKEASLAGKKDTIVARAAKKNQNWGSSRRASGTRGRPRASLVLSRLGQHGTGNSLNFRRAVEAHGVGGGAAARAVPAPGDPIAPPHDLGSELAKQIRDDASARHRTRTKSHSTLPLTKPGTRPASKRSKACSDELASRRSKSPIRAQPGRSASTHARSLRNGPQIPHNPRRRRERRTD